MSVTIHSSAAGSTLHSILYNNTGDAAPKDNSSDPPDYFMDLNLDQVVDALTAGREIYHLKPFFYTQLHHNATIIYRQQVMKDMEDLSVYRHITAFSNKIREMHRALSHTDRYPYEKKRLFLDAVLFYVTAVHTL